MPYATLDQLTARYGEGMLVMLTDRGIVPRGVVDEVVVTRALADADALIDGYLAGRYVLPLASVPPLVAQLAAQIAIWNLHVTTPEQKISEEKDAAISQLRDIAKGVILLPSSAGDQPSGTGSGGVIVTDRSRPMSADQMTGFI
jgi:phage gp36-like protein